MATSSASKLALTQPLKDVQGEEPNKKRELEITAADDQQDKTKRVDRKPERKKQVHWDLAPMPPSSAYSSAQSGHVYSDLPQKAVDLPRSLEPHPDLNHYDQPHSGRRGSSSSWGYDTAFSHATPTSNFPSTLLQHCGHAAPTWEPPSLPVTSMPWLTSSLPQLPPGNMAHSDPTIPACAGPEWRHPLKLAPMLSKGPENPQALDSNGDRSIEPNGAEPLAEEAVQGESSPVVVNIKFGAPAPGMPNVMTTVLPTNHDSGNSIPPQRSYATDNMITQVSATDRPANASPATVIDIAFNSHLADQAAAYGYAPHSPTDPEGGYTPPNSVVDSSPPTMPPPAVAPTFYDQAVKQEPAHGYPPAPEGYVRVEETARQPEAAAWPAPPPPEHFYSQPIMQAPHPYAWQYGQHYVLWSTNY
ncbi:uncharacterized protein PV07_08577 [Cladophialophora immunda]|uniref:Uncharacterized protein n=1 Tax=Cladophialophora immunda TaxID=569365 RepID=A0A0D2C4J3_9EURO|nr:uncharacterized protein PV07_08577 [Cladophialophora immunda]KIW25400.1 hypothetical protein PV07_08577 [Cladophialophora immunda]